MVSNELKQGLYEACILIAENKPWFRLWRKMNTMKIMLRLLFRGGKPKPGEMSIEDQFIWIFQEFKAILKLLNL